MHITFLKFCTPNSLCIGVADPLPSFKDQPIQKNNSLWGIRVSFRKSKEGGGRGLAEVASAWIYLST